MPYCPNCHCEFQRSVLECPDCEVALVDDLGAVQRDPLAPFGLLAEDEVLDLVRAFLQRQRVPHRNCVGGVEIPVEFTDVVLARLDGVLAWEEAGPQAVRLTELLEEIPEPPALAILAVPVTDLDDAGLAQVRELLARGDPQARQLAWRRLREACDGRGIGLEAHLLEAIGAGRRAEVFGCTRVMVDEGAPAELVWKVAERIPELAPEGMVLALHVLAQLPDRGVAPLMIPLLEHEDPEVRTEADEVLCCLSGTDMGFDAAAPDQERAEAVKRWRDWAEK